MTTWSGGDKVAVCGHRASRGPSKGDQRAWCFSEECWKVRSIAISTSKFFLARNNNLGDNSRAYTLTKFQADVVVLCTDCWCATRLNTKNRGILKLENKNISLNVWDLLFSCYSSWVDNFKPQLSEPCFSRVFPTGQGVRFRFRQRIAIYLHWTPTTAYWTLFSAA